MAKAWCLFFLACVWGPPCMTSQEASVDDDVVSLLQLPLDRSEKIQRERSVASSEIQRERSIASSEARVMWGNTTFENASDIPVLLQYMMHNASSLKAQAKACRALHELGAHHRSEPSTWVGLRVNVTYLDAGIGEAFAQGVLNIYNNKHESAKDIENAAMWCLDGIDKLYVTNDADLSIHLLNNAPHMWDALLTATKFHINDRDLLMTRPDIVTFAGLYGTPQPMGAAISLGEKGGYDLIFQIIERWKGDDEVVQAALGALSDNVNTGHAPGEYVVNSGGPLKGIEFLVNLMPEVLGRQFKQAGMFGLQYELVHDTVGLLWHDDDKHTRRNEFYRLGYLDNLLALMRDNPSDQYLQDNGCQALYYLTEGNMTVQSKAVEGGALELVATAFKKFGPEMIEGYCTVVHSCSAVLSTMAESKPEWSEQIRLLGIKEVITDELLEFQITKDSQTPTHYDFPGYRIYELKQFLM